MADSALRIFLAVYLAIWSPAVCCCALTVGCGRFADGKTDASALAPAPLETCCQLPAEPVEAACCETSRDAPMGSPEDGCDCRERLLDRIPLHTGGKVVVPAATPQPDVVALFESTFLRRPSFAHGVAGPMPSQHAHPPPSALHAQHCLFLI